MLERVTYANDDNAWSVAKLVVAGKTELVTAVGNLLGVRPGESLRLPGRWATDKKYGEQFRVEVEVRGARRHHEVIEGKQARRDDRFGRSP